MHTILMMALIEGCGMFKAVVPSWPYEFTKFDRAQMRESSRVCMERTDTCMIAFYIHGDKQYQVVCEGKGDPR
jgi:hypothetical protein